MPTNIAKIFSIVFAFAFAIYSGSTVADTITVRSSPPVIAAPQFNQTTPKYNAFGSVAISAASLPAARKWRDVTDQDYTGFFGAACTDSFSGCNGTFGRKVSAAIGIAQETSGVALLSLANRTVNSALTYRSDAQNWHSNDYWATVSEMAVKGAGDCEDFATAKYWFLRAAGVSERDLQVVVLSDTRRQLYHAVLAVYLDGQIYILDNLSSRVRRDSQLPNYMPIMSFANGKSYIHGFTNRTSGFAGSFDAVSPGEGI
ncbi:transglutaminase-like cysteine peptidase [Devosia sp. SL43]|uniref:transglutaminase-like cysteine peptidase n=1 Tax=Devosia sp. SL43 TaxID=2806348 RepID=UPI001F285C44|nr:transglutaminase-like cysteine peptidase [Devosia sp. SL43]UJW83978.1 transglutaminase-like cysteine peptidase [Devosia sp. SL43]